MGYTDADTVAEIVLLAAGIMALLIVITYLKYKDSSAYTVCVVLGIIVGAATIALAAINYDSWTQECVIIAIVTGYAMVIRPFKNIDFAVVLGILGMIIAYAYLGTLDGDLAGLSHGTPRIIVAVLAGALVYLIFSFITKVAMLLGKLLNWWPFLLILSILCIAEAVLIMSGSGTLMDIYHDHFGDSGGDTTEQLAHLFLDNSVWTKL